MNKLNDRADWNKQRIDNSNDAFIKELQYTNEQVKILKSNMSCMLDDVREEITDDLDNRLEYIENLYSPRKRYGYIVGGNKDG